VWIGIAVPAGTPPAVVERLNGEFNRALAAPDLRAKLATLGVEPVGGTSAQMTQYVREDAARWAKIIKQANIKIE
jgi:tripartite-type tricarboxylate transporter receptor subunit TctC